MRGSGLRSSFPQHAHFAWPLTGRLTIGPIGVTIVTIGGPGAPAGRAWMVVSKQPVCKSNERGLSNAGGAQWQRRSFWALIW
ncbi:MAG: hypothetical protein ACC645_25520, partial [Pirellulales bacterium]